MSKSKKHLNIEDNNKNMAGVSALFHGSSEPATKDLPKVNSQEDDLKSYPLRLKKSLFKKLEIRRVETGIPIRQQIEEAILKFYKF